MTSDSPRAAWRVCSWSIALLLAILPPGTFAAPAFQRYNVSHGLANNVAFDVQEDKYGFVWVTTRNGISKFDGSEFTTFRPVPPGTKGQVAQFYQTIYTSRDGALWFCSWGNGLLRLDIDTERFTFFRHDPADPQSIASDHVWFAFEDRDGMMWVSSLGGLSRLDPRTGKARVYRHDPQNPNTLAHFMPTQVVQDASGALWIGTYGGGLDRLDPRTENFTHYRHQSDVTDSLSADLIETLFLDPDGTLWVATDGGLDHFDPASGRFRHFRHDPNDPQSLSSDVVLEVMRDSRGRLWTANWGGGIHLLDESTGKFTHYSYDPSNPLGPSTNLVEYFSESQDGAMWFASFNGLNRYDEQGGRFRLLLQQRGLPGSRGDLAVSGVLQDRQGRLWATSDDLGLLRYDPRTNERRVYALQAGDPHSLSNTSATSIKMSPEGDVWIGTRGGLNRYDAQKDQFERFTVAQYGAQGMGSDNITDLAFDSNGVLWLAMYGVGVQRFDPRRKVFTLFQHNAADPTSLANDQTNAIRVASDGGIWVAADAGLSRLDPETGKFMNFSAGQAGLSSIIVNAIAEAPDGAMLFGTDVGVNVYDPRTRRFKAYTIREGMPSNYVMALEADRDGNIWAGTDKGLVRIDARSGRTRVYDVNDGLPSNQFWNHAAYRAPDGTLYFGSTNGLTGFRPEELRDNPTPPRVYITELSLFNREVVPGRDSPLKTTVHLARSITLNHQQSSLGFKFAALNYRWPGKNQYAYKLEGFDPDWIRTDHTKREATYTNLAPGRYVFRVRASNNDGVWNNEGASLAITILPPWWQTWPFQAFVLFAILATIYAGYRLRVRRFESRARELQLLVDERTRDLKLAKEAAEVANRAKSQFLAGISHELRTPLNAILGYAQILKRARNLDDRQITGVSVMQQSGEHLLTLINDILDTAKIEAGKQELHPVTIRLPRFLQSLLEIIRVKAEAKRLELVGELDPHLPEGIVVDETLLRQVLLNLLSNAVKFTDRGRVGLRVAFQPASRLRFEVWDTGIGIRAEDLRSIFEPFTQVSDTQHRLGGTGLGLVISRQFVRLMGSDIEVTSREGQGSTFSFTLDVQVMPAQHTQPPASRIVGYQGTRRTVLVVDDIVENRVVAGDLLREVGFEICEAVTGRDALGKVRSMRPDLILMDVYMPDMDGLEAIRCLRQVPGMERLPIIAVSASVSGGDQQSCLQAGADAFVSKPVDETVLLEKIGVLLQLEWIWESIHVEASVPETESASLVIPPNEQLQKLHAMALEGSMRDVAQMAAHLSRMSERYQPFAEHLISLANRFQSKALVAFLEEHLDKAPSEEESEP